MPHISATRYERITNESEVDPANGVFVDRTSGDIVLIRAGTVVATILSTGLDIAQTSQAIGDMLYRSSTTAFARLAKGTLGQFLQMNAGATAPEWDSIKTKWPFRIPAASGKDTDAKKGGLAGCDQALDVTVTEAAATCCQVYDKSAASKWAALETASAADFVQWQLLPNNTQDGDIVHFGHSIPFCEIWLDMSATVSTYTGNGLTWEYWNGTAWSALTFAHDYTDATAQDGKRSFGRDGALSFVPPADWTAVAVNGVTKYWIRAKVSTVASLVVLGITNGRRHYICAPTDGFIVPHACTMTDIAVRDEAGTVHTAADIKFILFNFTTGASTAALTFAQDKRNKGFSGLTLSCAADDVLGVLISQEDGTDEAGPFTLELGVTLV